MSYLRLGYFTNESLFFVILLLIKLYSSIAKDARLLVETTASFVEFPTGFYTIFGDKVLPTDPRFELIAGNVKDTDILIGHSQDELSFFLAAADLEYFGLFGGKTKNPIFSKSVGERYIRAMFKNSPTTEKELIVQHYLGDTKGNNYKAIREQTYQSIGDYVIICSVMNFAQNYARKGKNVYAYYFNHVPSVTPWAPWMGSVQFDDVAFVFGRPLDYQSDYTKVDKCLSCRLIKIWTTFAKTGKPGEKWPKFSTKNPNFKEFNPYNRTSYLNSHKKNCEFFRPIIGFP